MPVPETIQDQMPGTDFRSRIDWATLTAKLLTDVRDLRQAWLDRIASTSPDYLSTAEEKALEARTSYAD